MLITGTSFMGRDGVFEEDAEDPGPGVDPMIFTSSLLSFDNLSSSKLERDGDFIDRLL